MASRSSDFAHALIRILTTLSGHEGDAAIRTLAEECSIPKSTLHRTLLALKEEGWVYQEEGGNYRIGLRLLVLANQSRLRTELVKQLMPVMRYLAKFTGQTILLNVQDNLESVCLHTIESNKRIKIDSQIGSRGPLYAGSSGKVLLAFAPPDVLEEVLSEPLRRYTPFTITDPVEVRAEVEKILKDRYAASIEEIDPGAAAVSVPILHTSGDLVAGISVVGPRFDFDGKIEKWAREMIRVTGNLFDYDAVREGARL